jgi:hypothetical protein
VLGVFGFVLFRHSEPHCSRTRRVPSFYVVEFRPPVSTPRPFVIFVARPIHRCATPSRGHLRARVVLVLFSFARPIDVLHELVIVARVLFRRPTVGGISKIAGQK